MSEDTREEPLFDLGCLLFLLLLGGIGWAIYMVIWGDESVWQNVAIIVILGLVVLGRASDIRDKK